MRSVMAGLVGAVGLVPMAHALTIVAGSDYLTTVAPTTINFGLWGNPFGLTVVDFEGAPTGPGTTDTIITRLGDGELSGVGDTVALPIELTTFSLLSTGPVVVAGTPYDLRLELDGASPSLGQLASTLDDAAAPSGSFTSFLDVFFQLALLDLTTGVPEHTLAGLPALRVDAAGHWSSTPPAGALLVTGAPGDRRANTHDPLATDFFDFYMDEVLFAAGADNTTLHQARTSIIPEPGSATLLCLGALGMGITRRWRQGFRKPVAMA